MKVENNQIIIEENDLASILPFNEKMSKTDCYNKGMFDFAKTVKVKIDNARQAKEQHSYMYWGAIFDSLLDDLEHLTHSVISFKR